MRDHAFWLIERGVDADRQRWVWLRDLLVDTYGWWASRGHQRIYPERRRGREKLDPPLVVDWQQDLLPHEGPFPPSSMSVTSLDVNLGRALLQLTAFVHSRLLGEASSAVRACQRGGNGQLRFAPLGDDSGQIIARIGFMKGKPFTLEALYLGPVDLANGRLAGVDLTQTDLSGGYLRGCSLAQAHLGVANLAGADLTAASLNRASLPGANLRGATFRGADLRFADLDPDASMVADFEGAEVHGTSLEE